MLDAASDMLFAFEVASLEFACSSRKKERVYLSLPAANDLARLVELQSPRQAHLYRLLARTHPISDVMQTVSCCSADFLPASCCLVVQEAYLSLRPILGALDAAEAAELSPNALTTRQAQVGVFRCWCHLPSGDTYHGEHLCTAWRAHVSPRESSFLLVVGFCLGGMPLLLARGPALLRPR